MKSWTHEPQIVTKSFLNNARTAKKDLLQNELFDLESMEGKPIEDIYKKVYFDLCGVLPYFFDAADYMFTHHVDMIETNTKNNYYMIGSPPPNNEAMRFSWKIFEDVAGISKFPNQKKLLLTELERFKKTPQYRWMPDGTGRLVFTEPFRIQIYTKKIEEINYNDLKKYNNLGVLPFESIVIEVFKPLYSGMIEHTARRNQQPPGQYAIIRNHNRQLWRAGIYADKTEIFNPETGADTRAITILKMLKYLQAHDNGIGDHREIDILDFLRYVASECIKGGNQGEAETIRWDRAYEVFFNSIRSITDIGMEYENAYDFIITAIEWPLSITISDTPEGHLKLFKEAVKAGKGKLKLGIKRRPKTNQE
ncbi:hypothetical protein FACS189479_04930 [Spirochaetia bacterium]|nr:hypothetical protein FACS189479_04930 [Spirochaetia bacterium]